MDIDLESGAFVGEINSIINSDGINTTNLKAVTDVKAFQIKKYKLCAFLSSNPGYLLSQTQYYILIICIKQFFLLIIILY